MLMTNEDKPKDKKKKDKDAHNSSKYINLRPMMENKIDIIKKLIFTLDEVRGSDGNGYDTADILVDVFNEDYDSFVADIPDTYRGVAAQLFESLLEDFDLVLNESPNELTESGVLDVQQRRKKALIMRRYKSKIMAARRRSAKRRASQDKIKVRASRTARTMLKKRFTQGKSYAKMTPSERLSVDKRMKRIPDSIVKRLATRIIPKVRQAENKRLSAKKPKAGEDKSKKIPTAVVKSAISKANDRVGVDVRKKADQNSQERKDLSSKDRLKEALQLIIEQEKFEKADLPKKSETCGISRVDMPQVKLDDLRSLKMYLTKTNVGYVEENIDPEDLIATQKEFNIDKVNSILKDFKEDSDPILISKDNYILDGHHRWLAFKKKEVDIPVLRIQKDLDKAMFLLAEYPKTFNKEIHESKENSDV